MGQAFQKELNEMDGILYFTKVEEYQGVQQRVHYAISKFLLDEGLRKQTAVEKIAARMAEEWVKMSKRDREIRIHAVLKIQQNWRKQKRKRAKKKNKKKK